MPIGREAWKVWQTGGGRQSAVEANVIVVHGTEPSRKRKILHWLYSSLKFYTVGGTPPSQTTIVGLLGMSPMHSMRTRTRTKSHNEELRAI